MIKLTAIAAMLTAQAPEAPCLDPRTAGDAAIVALPYVVRSVAKSCGPRLPAGAFLNTGAPALVERLKAAGTGRYKAAAEAFRAISGGDMPAVQDEEALVRVMGELAAAKIAEEMNPQSCRGIDGMISALAPLPAENLAGLVSSMIVLIDTPPKPSESRDADGKVVEPEKKSGKPVFCRND